MCLAAVLHARLPGRGAWVPTLQTRRRHRLSFPSFLPSTTPTYLHHPSMYLIVDCVGRRGGDEEEEEKEGKKEKESGS